MRVVILEDAQQVGSWAAEYIGRLVRQKPTVVLGLATGGTPVLCYQRIIAMHQEEGLSFSRVRTFNLDEYVGLPADDPNSYRSFMRQQLFDHIDIPASSTHVPDGMATDVTEHCRHYEQQIQDVGGIDLQLLGIGSDGHIAFNEPGSSLASRTRLKALAARTLQDNARFFGTLERVPRLAITMGVGTILEARQCLLLATGENKATAIRDAIEGPLTSQITASALQLHPQATLVLDEAAAAKLEQADYYRKAEALQVGC